VLAGHTHKQLTYRNPGMSFEVFCCGTTQHEPRASVGGRDEEDAKSGNLFQIITVTSNAEGLVDVSARDFRYTGSDGRDGRSYGAGKRFRKAPTSVRRRCLAEPPTAADRITPHETPHTFRADCEPRRAPARHQRHSPGERADAGR
jgi:hypothetical protein